MFSRWVNIKWLFAESYDATMSGVRKMLHKLGMRFTGEQHNGLVDANNIKRLALRMMKDDCRFELNDGVDRKYAVRFDRGVGISYVRPCDKVCTRCGNLVFKGYKTCARCNCRKLENVYMEDECYTDEEIF